MNLCDDSWYAVIDFLCSQKLVISKWTWNRTKKKSHHVDDFLIKVKVLCCLVCPPPPPPPLTETALPSTVTTNVSLIDRCIWYMLNIKARLATHTVIVAFIMVGWKAGVGVSLVVSWSTVKWGSSSPPPHVSLTSDSRKISMKDRLHLLSADTNPIYPRYEVTRCLHTAWTPSPRSTRTEIKTRTCCLVRSAFTYSCLRCQGRCVVFCFESARDTCTWHWG